MLDDYVNELVNQLREEEDDFDLDAEELYDSCKKSFLARVNEAIKGESIAGLFFSNNLARSIFPPPTKDTDQMVLWILDNARVRRTYQRGKSPDTAGYQCREGAYRSSLDIWRIAKFYFGANIKLSDIMKSLANLSSKGEISTHICSTIDRRVFWVDVELDAEMFDESSIDEFLLKLDDWCEIGVK